MPSPRRRECTIGSNCSTTMTRPGYRAGISAGEVAAKTTTGSVHQSSKPRACRGRRRGPDAGHGSRAPRWSDRAVATNFGPLARVSLKGLARAAPGHGGDPHTGRRAQSDRIPEPEPSLARSRRGHCRRGRRIAFVSRARAYDLALEHSRSDRVHTDIPSQTVRPGRARRGPRQHLRRSRRARRPNEAVGSTHRVARVARAGAIRRHGGRSDDRHWRLRSTRGSTQVSGATTTPTSSFSAPAYPNRAMPRWPARSSILSRQLSSAGRWTRRQPSSGERPR